VQTEVCGATKGVQTVDVEARPGRGADRRVCRHRRPGRGWPEREAGCGGETTHLEDRGEGIR